MSETKLMRKPSDFKVGDIITPTKNAPFSWLRDQCLTIGRADDFSEEDISSAMEYAES